MEHLECNCPIYELQESIESWKSDYEDLKYHYLSLLRDYSIVVSQEGYANKNDIETTWLEKIKYIP